MAFLIPGQPVHKWLYGVAWCYGLLIRIRSWCYRRGWFASVRLPCRVISVGNLTVGGTGKTPTVILLTEWLQAKGLRVAILSRGYKRTRTVPQLLVSDGVKILAGPAEAGDEPVLLAHRCPKAIVAVGIDRVALGQWILEQFPIDCVILDDGFQHRALHRDIDLVLLDATDAVGLDGLLPAGRLREPLKELGRANAAVITRADVPQDVHAIRNRLQTIPFPAEDTVEVVFEPDGVMGVTSQEARPVSWALHKKAWLVSGIGNSQSFRRSAESVGIVVIGETVFEDHHSYSLVDVQGVRGAVQTYEDAIVLTTEKDAVKVVSLLGVDDPWWALRLRARVTKGEAHLRRLIDVPPSDGITSGAHG